MVAALLTCSSHIGYSISFVRYLPQKPSVIFTVTQLNVLVKSECLLFLQFVHSNNSPNFYEKKKVRVFCFFKCDVNTDDQYFLNQDLPERLTVH